MAFMGETGDIGVAELLSVLARRRHAGRLSISGDGDETQIFLHDGNVILVNSTNHALRLGRILVRLGLIDGNRLEDAIREQSRNGRGRPLGQILVEKGWITADGLARAAEEQCVEALTRVVVTKHGTFMFARDVQPTVKKGLVTLNTDGIVLEASRRADEMLALQAVLPPASAKLSLSKKQQPVLATLTSIERQVVETLGAGSITLPELTDKIEVEEASLWRSVVSLRERGILVTKGANGDERDEQTIERIAPRTVGEIVSLSMVGRGPEVSKIPSLPEIRAGVAAGAQTVAAVTSVVREVIAAFNAGLALHAFAHFTNDHFRRSGQLPNEELEILNGPAHPLAPEEQETFVTLRDVRVLADRRLSAILVTHLPAAGEGKKVVIFAYDRERWRIDAVVEAPTPSAAMKPVFKPVGNQPHTAAH